MNASAKPPPKRHTPITFEVELPAEIERELLEFAEIFKRHPQHIIADALIAHFSAPTDHGPHAKN